MYALFYVDKDQGIHYWKNTVSNNRKNTWVFFSPKLWEILKSVCPPIVQKLVYNKSMIWIMMQSFEQDIYLKLNLVYIFKIIKTFVEK